MPSNGYTLSIECILKEAKFRWLKGYEVLCILQNYQTYGLQLSTAAPIDPQSGSLFLFNKRLVKFRKDGINWKKQKDGKTVRESHEKLKVGGVKVLSCCYTRSADNSAFQRRIYWLLDGDPTTVLVHYLLLEKDSAAFAHGSGENETDARTFPVHSGLLHNESGEEKEPDSASDPSGDEVEQPNPAEFNFGTIPSQNNPLNESLMDFVNSLISPEHHASPVGSLGTVSHYPNTAVHNGMSQQEHLVNLQPTPAPSQPLPSASCLGRLAKVTDFSPEWDYMEGGAKVIITGPDFQRGINYYCMFDQMEVQAEVVLDGVLRCRVPPHSTPGFVSFCITRGNFVLFSEVKHFEYRKRESSTETQLSLNDRSFKLRIIERLERLEREVNSSNSISTFTLSQSMMDNLSKMLEDKFLNEEQLEQVFTKILANLVELLDNKEFINGQDKDGFTLLHCACALRYHLLAQTLIQWGVNVNLQDITGNTPFHWAMKNRDQKMMKVLVDYVDLNKSVYNQMDFTSKTNSTNSSVIQNPPTPSNNNVENISSKIDDIGLRALNPDAAATTIQSAFRGWRVREELSEKDDPTSPQQDNRDRFWDRLESVASKTNQTTPPDSSGVRMRLAVRQRETKKKEHEAAKKIQVAFKDYKTRRMQQNVSDSQKRSHDSRVMRVNEKRK